MPTGCSPGCAAIFRYSAAACSRGTPNLLMCRPVEIWGCVPASMSGLTRSATLARTPLALAARSMRSSSPADSALMAFNPSCTARSISSGDFPTPLKTMSSGANPARIASSTSPIELASTALPASRSSRTTASDEFAFMA